MRRVVWLALVVACRSAPIAQEHERPPAFRIVRVDAAERSALVALLRTVHDRERHDRAPFCVVLSDSTERFEVDAEFLRDAELVTHPRPVLRIRDCPPTYTSMITWVGKPKPPPGYVDPHVIRLSRIKPWTDSAVATVDVRQGTISQGDRCVIRRENERLRVRCRTEWSHIE